MKTNTVTGSMKVASFLILLVISFPTLAQDQNQEEAKSTTKDLARPAFESALLGEMQSVMVQTPKTLEWDFQHRFGTVENGLTDFYGIYAPGANIRMGLTYTPMDRLAVGIGLTRNKMALDLNAKYAIFRQTKEKGMPVSVSYYGNVVANTQAGNYKEELHRLSFYNEHAIGNQKPSDFLHTAITQLNSLGVTKDNNADLLRRYFLASLSPSIRALLTVVDESTAVDKLALIADKSFEILNTGNTLSMAAAATPAQTFTNTDTTELALQLQTMQTQFNTLQQSISAITAQLNNLNAPVPRQNAFSAPRNRNFPRQVLRSKSPGRMTCFYHTKFGRDARKCMLGCRYYTNSYAVDNPMCIYHHKFQQQARSCVPGCKFNKNNTSRPSSPSFLTHPPKNE